MEETLLNAQLPATIDASFAPGTLPDSLRSGKAPVIAVGIEQAIPELKDPNVQLGMFVGPGSGLAWGVRKGSRELRKEMDSFLGAFLASGQWNKLVVRYFGASAPDLLKKARSEG
jgi:ABC-type amino acid transport substrate-binding protein